MTNQSIHSHKSSMTCQTASEALIILDLNKTRITDNQVIPQKRENPIRPYTKVHDHLVSSQQIFKESFSRCIFVNNKIRIKQHIEIPDDRFIYLGFYIAFNTVQVISRRVVGRSEETSIYSLSGFCTVNCQPMARNYQLSHLRPCREPNPGLRGGR